MPIYDSHGQPVYSSNPGANLTTTGPDLRELGLPGTLLLSGFILEEQNPALQGRRGLDVMKAMGYDPTVAMMLKSIELPIRATQWHVEPADDSQQAIDLADFVHANLWEFGLSGGASDFDDTLRQAVTGRNQYGFAPFEIVYRVAGEDDEYPGKVMIDKFAWRAQWTRYKWNVEEVDLPDGGRMRKLISMTQWAPPFYQYTVIPADKMALFVRDMNGENFDGVALLRASYKPWWIRDRLYSIQAVGLERGYMGVPIGKLPMSYTAGMQQLMQDIVQGFRTHERAGAVVREDMDIQMLFNKLEGAPMKDAIDHMTSLVVFPALAQFLLLGQKEVGSFALSNDQSDLFLMSLNADCNYVASVMNKEPVIPTLIDFNFPNVPKSLMPRLAHGDVGQRNLDKVIRGLAQLAQWGVIVPDDPLEDSLREMMGLPERDGTVTPEYLGSLLQAIHTDPGIPKQHDLERPAIPGATNPNAQGGHGGTDLPPQAIAAAEKKRKLDKALEMQARMPWKRHKGRLDDESRIRLRAAEGLLGFMEDMRSNIGRPEKPSIRAWRARRPYVIQSDRVPVRMAETGKKKDGTYTRAAVVANKHKAALKDFILARGKAQRTGRVPIPADAKYSFDERPVEVLQRPPLHVHDQNGQVDDQPCLAFDLNLTLTEDNSYPLNMPPYPGAKELLDRLKSQGCCIHVTSAGLYIGDKHDLDVQAARIAMCQAWATSHGLPIDLWLPKGPANVFVDDRMVNALDHDFDRMSAEIDSVLQRRFKMGDDGLWHRFENGERGKKITDFPDPAELDQDHPRGFSGPIIDIDVHSTTLDATSSQRSGLPMPGAVDAIKQLYNVATIHLSCAGWNPATKDDPTEVEQRLAAQRQQLLAAGIPYDRLVTKDHCEVYVDDKGVPFTTWEETLPKVLDKLAHPSPTTPTPDSATPGDVEEKH